MYSVLKNSYVKHQYSLDSKLVNRSVDAAFPKKGIDYFDASPALLRLVTAQPHFPVQNVDIVRAEQAYGRWALPKLYKELYHEDQIIALQAINTICDLLQDPEKAFEAIRLKFVPRLINLLNDCTNIAVKDRVLLALRAIASHSIGRDTMITHGSLILSLKELLVTDEIDIRSRASAVVEMLSHSFMVCCTLIERNFIPLILEQIGSKKHVIFDTYLKILKNLFLLPDGAEQAVQCKGVEIVASLLNNEDLNIVIEALNCLALLLSVAAGKKVAEEMKLLVTLNNLLSTSKRTLYKAVLSVLMFATITVNAKHQAANLPMLADILMALANDTKDSAVQMHSLKVLGNICEHPKVRKQFYDFRLKDVEAINTCGNETLENCKNTLISIIKWKPWMC